ncbi:PREDICTED: c-X-C motif chemokine 10 [Elephantulus edwardii]|uniref:c-X-C motif chemokine 10 n=1 Tax=Elephantulus edwardii TaxID=28737 RepID=UPI0003F0998A|nr:PREDICTED: c-X-C motif chemokine 10 [Elephantulus edwardii]
MDHTTILLFCLIFLTLSGTQGMPFSRNIRCSCIKIYDRPVNPKSLEKLEMIPANVNCSKTEIIVTMKKSGEKRCLNPDSKNVKNILKAISKERSKRSPKKPGEA